MERSKHIKSTDVELIDKYINTQSQYYFSLLYDRYANKVYSKCISLLRNEAAAQDAAQEIFMKIFLNITKFNKKSRFSTWVYSITYNYCIDKIRKKKKEKTILTDEDKGKEDIIEEVSDHELFQIEFNRLKIILEMIPIEDKAVLLMKYREELTIKEISESFAKSQSAVKMKIKRAKFKVREIYKKKFAEV